jgi:DNA-binding GntR family transcriptional regulator
MKSALQQNDLVAWAGADDRFHRSLIDQCGNRRVARLANTIMDQSHRARMMTLRLRPKPTRSMKEHQAITAAIRKGDPSEAASQARKHRQRARDELLPLLDRLGMKQL